MQTWSFPSPLNTLSWAIYLALSLGMIGLVSWESIPCGWPCLHSLLKHSVLLATVISSRMGKLVPSRNVIHSCWEGNGLILAVKSELSLFLLMESLQRWRQCTEGSWADDKAKTELQGVVWAPEFSSTWSQLYQWALPITGVNVFPMLESQCFSSWVTWPWENYLTFLYYRFPHL